MSESKDNSNNKQQKKPKQKKKYTEKKKKVKYVPTSIRDIPTPSDSELGPLSIWKRKVCEALGEVIGLTADQLDTVVQISGLQDASDFALNVNGLNRFRKDGFKFPDNLKAVPCAELWAKMIQPGDVLSKASTKNSYLNLFVNQEKFVEDVMKAASEENFGKFTFGKDKTIYCEFSSPNIAKPFHAGHLRSTVIGNYICKLHKQLGYTVISENYLGDWGKQYGLLALAFEKYGDDAKLESEPIKHLFELYVNINKEKKEDPQVDIKAREYFKKMEDGDAQALGLWKKMRDMSIIEYKKTYKRLNVEFDIYGGESEHCDGMMEQLEVLKKCGLLTSPPEAKGAQIVELEDYGLINALVVKGDGASLYLTRDIDTAVTRWKANHFDHMYYVVAAQQDLHFQQLFKTLELMGHGDWSHRLTHINFGMVKGMSTRSGNVVFLSNILDEAENVMLDKMRSSEMSKIDEIEDPEATAAMIGLSAVVVQDGMGKRRLDYMFEWDRVTKYEGNTGVYLQYAHSRMASICRKVLAVNPEWDLTNLEYDAKLLPEESAKEMAMQIALYPKAVYDSFKQLESRVLISYMFDLTRAFSHTHRDMQILGSEEKLAKSRLALLVRAQRILAMTLGIIGLNPVSVM